MTVSKKSITDYIKNNIEGKRPSINFINKYRKAIGVDRNKTNHIVNKNVLNSISHSLIFIVDRPNYFFLRVSNSLKKKGYKTILITRWGVSKEHAKFFSGVYLYDRFNDLENLVNVIESLYYVQQWPGWNFLAVYISYITKTNVFCNINDLTYTLFDNEKDLLTLPGWSEKDIDMDLQCEKHILNDCSLVTMNYTKHPLKLYSKKIYDSYGKRIITFPCYALPDFFFYKKREMTNNVKLLFVTGVPEDSKSDEAFKDAKLRGIVSDILSCGLSITIFNNPQLTVTESNQIESKYQYFNNLSNKNEKFNFQVGFYPWELKNNASEYHFGLILFVFTGSSQKTSSNHYAEAIPTKVFTYIELGLPIIVNEDLEPICNFVNKYGIGIVIPNDSICNLDKIINHNKNQYARFVDNMLSYRNQYNMDLAVENLILKMGLIDNPRMYNK